MIPRIACLTMVSAGIVFAAGPGGPPEAGIPAGWRPVAEEHFDTPESIRRWEMSDPGAWQFSADTSSRALELARQSKYEPPYRSPLNIALLAGQRFGDVVVEADLQQTGPEYGHRDMCVFFGVQDPTHFYYVHLASTADDHAHNIFVVNGAPRTKIARRTTTGIRWGQNVWHRVRVEHRVASGVIRVFFDDLTQPIMEAEDKTFGFGAIGFGSFDDTGKVDNVRVWSPEEATPGKTVFRTPK